MVRDFCKKTRGYGYYWFVFKPKNLWEISILSLVFFKLELPLEMQNAFTYGFVLFLSA
jgi:hypothetical protein